MIKMFTPLEFVALVLLIIIGSCISTIIFGSIMSCCFDFEAWDYTFNVYAGWGYWICFAITIIISLALLFGLAFGLA